MDMKRLFGVVILAIGALLTGYYGLVTYDNYFRYGRIRETIVVKPHEEPILPMEAGVISIDGGEAMLRAGFGKAKISPLDPFSEKTLAAGAKVYTTYCVFCHGKVYDGMGTVGQSFHPLPQNLKSARIQDLTDSSLFNVISYGIDRMPALATTVSLEDRWAVIHYLRSLMDRPERSS